MKALVWVAITTLSFSVLTRIDALPSGLLPEISLSHRMQLSKDFDFDLLWTPQEKDLIFEARVATRGYVGIGFSPSGGMKGADIVIGWVDDVTGEVILHDRYSPGYEVPRIDASQDVELLGGYQNDTHTVIRFSRPWRTCDEEEDIPLSNDTVRLIWAFNDMDPPSETVPFMHQQRGMKSVFLNEPRFTLPELSDDVKAWDLVAPNVSLPNDMDTLYWCKIFKIPPLLKKNHLIGYIPFVQEGNEEQVHHIVVYECNLKESEKYLEPYVDTEGAQCFSENMPISWSRCRMPLIAWAIGSEGEMYPEHVGFPIGEDHGGSTYFMLELHYDNPNLRQDVVDSSGLRLFHTEKLRKHEAGNLAVGHDLTPNMIIPPGQKWLSVGHCVSECTQQGIKAEGIKVFHGLLHSHLLGSSIKLRQFRDGRELPTIFEDKTYDFNYQQIRVLKEEMKILPGDYLMTECGYDATNRIFPTFGGLGTNDEMCLIFLSYYPRSSNLALCASRPSIKNIYESVGFEEIYDEKEVLKSSGWGGRKKLDEEEEKKMAEKMKKEGFTTNGHSLIFWHMFKGIKAKSPEKFKDTTLFSVLNEDAIWDDMEWRRNLQNLSIYGRHHVSCHMWGGGRKNRKGIPDMVDYPNFITLEQDREECTP